MRTKVLAGQICRNEQDIVGIVIRQSNVTGMISGVTFDGELWQSENPVFVAHSVNEYWNMFQDQK